MQYLDEQAKQLEADTGIAGTEILKAFQNIGSIAPALLENKELLAATTKEVVALSQASGLSLPEAAEAALGALNQFGEGADQAARYVNVLAAGALKGASEVNDTAAALKNAGTSMSAAGLSFEQGNALIQVLASTMIRGGEAGTGLRNVLLKLETSADKNLRPSVVGLDKALENASKKFNNTTALSKEFGVENINVARQVIENRAEIEKLTTAITGTGVAYQQQKTVTDNLATDLAKAGSGITAFIRSIGEEQDGMLRKITQSFTTFIQSLASKSGTLRAFVSNTIKAAVSGEDVDIFENTKKAYDRNKAADARKSAVDKLQKETLERVKKDTEDAAKAYEEQGQTVATAQRSAAAKVSQVRSEELAQVTKDLKAFKELLKGKTGAQNAGLKEEAFALKRRADIAAIAAVKANQEVIRLAKIDANAAEARRQANLETTPKTDAQKAAESAAKKAQTVRENIAKLQLRAETDYQQALTKLEEEFGKDRLEALNKDSEAYILEKAKYDKQVIEAERAKLETLYQLATSTQTRINKKTGERETVPNKGAKLPASAGSQYEARTAGVDAAAEADILKLRATRALQLLEITRQSDELEIEQAKRKWDEIIKADETGGKARLEELKKRDIERILLGQVINQIQQQQEVNLQGVDTKRFEDQLRAERGNALGIINIELEKERARLKIRIQSGQDLLDALIVQGEKENVVAIAQQKALIDALKKALGLLTKPGAGLDFSGPEGFFGSLLGLGGAELEAFKMGVSQISDVIVGLTNLQVEESQRRIDAIQAEIDAKKEQVDEEKERARDGYANNLSLREQELADLKAQKAAAQAENRKAVEQQQELDKISILSTNAVTVAKLIDAAASEFAKNAPIPFLGIALSLAAIATMYATITALRSKAKSEIKFREGGLPGGLINPGGRSHEQGGHKVEGTNYEFEAGEYILNRKVTAENLPAIDALNRGNLYESAMLLLRNSPLPAIQMPGGYEPAGSGAAQVDVERINDRIDQMSATLNTTLQRILEKPTPLADGRLMETKGSHTRFFRPLGGQ